MSPVRWRTFSRTGIDAVAGWGHAATARRARRLANHLGKPYLAFEDGPLRSVRPGPAEPPTSMVMDRSGIYYRSDAPSDLTALVSEPGWFDGALAERARQAAETLRRLRLSKYNAGLDRAPEVMRLGEAERVLVLDQVHGDASIAGALADAGAFDDMLAAAVAENPSAEIVVKQHPDVLSGRRRGYLTNIEPGARLTVVAEAVNPWSLLDAVGAVYTVSSGLGFEAALAAKRVVCFGSPFYAGWGFTDDRHLKVRRPRAASPLELFAAYYLRYAHYFDAWSRREIVFEEAVEQLAWMRDRFVGQGRGAVCYRISRWKRRPINRLLDGAGGPPSHTRDMSAAVEEAKRRGGRVVAWASRDNAKLEAACAEEDVPLEEVEDGFIRSAGLGATFVLPLSLVFDRRGIFYDSRRSSDLEVMLEEADFPSALVERASALRERLVAAGTTKYNVARSEDVHVETDGRPFILVPGQVEDDASIRRGSPLLKRNIELLEAVRRRHPEAFVVYKPHPDVEAGIRRGRVPADQAAAFADRVVTNASILALIAGCDRVETMTSLAGFEALLRGKPVTTHGQPFYAGWGLTEDLCPVERRTRQRSLDELVAAALILYPRYLDPVSGLPCWPELLVDRLAAEGGRPRSTGEHFVRAAQISFARALHLGQVARMMVRRGT